MRTHLVILVAIGIAAAGFAAESSDPKEKAPAAGASGPGITEQLAAAKRELAIMRERYKDGHPSVKAQLRKIAELEKQLAAESSRK